MAEELKKTDLKKRTLELCNRYAVLLQLAACVIICFVIECMARHSAAQALLFCHERTKVFLYNVLLIFMTTLPVFLFRKRVFFRSVVFSVWMILGVSNGILLANRVTPLTGPDLMMIKEGASVLGKYMSEGVKVVAVIFLIVLLAALAFLFFKGPSYRGKRDLRIIIPGILVLYLAFYGLTQYYYNAKLLSTYFGNIAFAYQDYGFPYCILVTTTDTGIDKPRNYSAGLIRGITGTQEEDESAKGEELPNIIVVQLESFFDPETVRFLSFSEDPLPNWHALSEAYTSGFYTVPTVGAGTVNTEFETLTGMSLRYFGAGEYPYKGVLKKETCESIGYILGDLGLSVHAVHNNYATFYSRKTVYANLGFEDFTSNEYMDNQDDVNETGWMRDRTLIPYIEECLDAGDERDFVFAVSVQGHGAYPSEDVITKPAIEVTGAASEANNSQWEYYVNQIHEMDQFVQDLIDLVEERGEPTVIMFYGDHLPTMGLADSDLTEGRIYQTRYLVWDNIGLSQEKKDICAYQAVAEMFDRMDLHIGTMFRFHQTMQDSYHYQLDMQTLQYDLLYGEKYVYGGETPYSKSGMVMGINEVLFNEMERVTDKIYYIRGSNFTQSSKVLVEDEEFPTFFVNDKTLLVSDLELESGQTVRIGQLSNSGSGKYLSYSNAIMFFSE